LSLPQGLYWGEICHGGDQDRHCQAASGFPSTGRRDHQVFRDVTWFSGLVANHRLNIELDPTVYLGFMCTAVLIETLHMAVKINFYLKNFFKIFVINLNTNGIRIRQSLDPDLAIPNPRPSSQQATVDRFLNDKKPSTSAVPLH